MPHFEIAYDLTKRHEGGYSKLPSDRGGETYAGISRRHHPEWEGWAVIDGIQNKKQGQFFSRYGIQPLVIAFYHREFWLKMRGDGIVSQSVANFVFDWFVHSGIAGLVEVQRTLGIKPDGIFGPITIAKLNGLNDLVLVGKLIAARTIFVQQIVSNDPSQQVNLKGWLNRINAYK